MKILMIADLHGHLPELPEVDLVLVAGDILPNQSSKQKKWFRNEFIPWMDKQKQVFFIAGNHDYHFVRKFSHPNYIRNKTIEYKGLRIYGSPWVLGLWDMPFGTTDNRIQLELENLPNDIDFFMTHGPPKGHADLMINGVRVGSNSVLEAIFDKNPKYVVTGHVHEAWGKYQIGNTELVSCSYLDHDYQVHNLPFCIQELP